MSLTPKQACFVEEYLIDLNATQAATRAGYSAKTANEQGAQLLAKLSIREAVAEAQAIRPGRDASTMAAALAFQGGFLLEALDNLVLCDLGTPGAYRLCLGNRLSDTKFR